MRKTNVLFAVLTFAAACFMAAADSVNIGSGGVEFDGGSVHYVTVAEPALPSSARNFSGGFGSEGKVLHRWMLDEAHQSFFGYDLTLQPIAGTPKCEASILPLSVGAGQINQHGAHVKLDASWKALQLPAYPGPQTVQPGDVIAIDLLVSADGTHKVVDYLQAACGSVSRPAATEESAARDLTLDDFPLDVVNGNLYLNGQPVSGTPTVGSATAPIVWFYFPGKGRFLVSIAQHDGYNFQKLGVIRRNRISFETGGDKYEVRASHEILGNAGARNAYVMLDPGYQPRKQSAEFGGSDRVEKILGH